MSLRWNDDQYGTGVPVVDAQHREMFDHIERMILATEVVEKEKEFADMLEFLSGYVVEHFRCEEQAMEERGCAALDDNKKDHEVFLEKLRDIQARYAQDGNTRPLREELMALTVQWLESHIAGVDAKLHECPA